MKEKLPTPEESQEKKLNAMFEVLRKSIEASGASSTKEQRQQWESEALEYIKERDRAQEAAGWQTVEYPIPSTKEEWELVKEGKWEGVAQKMIAD